MNVKFVFSLEVTVCFFLRIFRDDEMKIHFGVWGLLSGN